MSMIKALIIDDEAGCRELLNNLLTRYCPDVIVVSKASSAAEGFEKINTEKPQLVFLDIEMPGGNAFDLLGRFQEINFDIIFTTAYDQFAIKAIKYSAADYLLKPIDPDELKQAINKIISKKESNEHLNMKLKTLLENIRPVQKSGKIAVPDGDGYTFVQINEIIRCESDGNYTSIILSGGKKILASRTLGEFEDLFSDERFFRVHRSHLVNLEKIKKYLKGEGGYVILEDNSQVEVSRRKKAEFLEKLSQL
jgi:two-component system, LytTR family, response regulator